MRDLEVGRRDADLAVLILGASFVRVSGKHA